MGTKSAFITGITGQDGSYLARLLLDKGYDVYGLFARRRPIRCGGCGARPRSAVRLRRRRPHRPLVAGAGRWSSASRRNSTTSPRRASSATSWQQPLLTAQVTGARRRQLLEAVRLIEPQTPLLPGLDERDVRQDPASPTRTSTPFYPRSPYGVAKLYAHWITVNYRESFGMHASSGILFNHESPLRGIEFVTRKVTDAVARIKLGKQQRAAARQHRRQARLGLRRRLCRGHVADAAAGGRRLRGRHRPQRHRARHVRHRLRARGAGLRGPRGHRPRALSARPRSKCCWATRPRPRPSSAGSPAPTSSPSSR